MKRFPLVLLLALIFAISVARGADPFLKKNDVIALLGGENMVALSENGFFELTLTRNFPDFDLRFRNLAFEGDTVFEQNRDLNFPSWEEQLDKLGATVVVAQFGQMECLEGAAALPKFVEAYEKLIDRWSAGGKRRIVLLSPVEFCQSAALEKEEPVSKAPFERLKKSNEVMDEYIDAIRELAEKKHALFINVSNLGADDVMVQRDGIHLTNSGYLLMGSEMAQGLGGHIDAQARRLDAAANRLRQVIVGKNRLWFNYWRVQNWAFLAGDRTNQPSSRDWRDPSIRWFPAERELFMPLIETQEKQIWEQAAELP